MRWLLASAILLTSLAGCSDDAPAEDADTLVPQEIKVADRKMGAISGVIVDETIRPIGMASIGVRHADGTNETVQSDETGRFVLEALEPGLYFLSASAAGYFDAQQAVEVFAGQVANPKLLLQIDRTPQPFHETFDFNGILRASDWYGTYTLTVLLGNTELCECEFFFDVPDTVSSIVMEAFWEPKLGDPEHELYFELETVEPAEGKASYSTAPLNRAYPRTVFDPAATEFLVRVSSGIGVDVDQEFELFVTLFHLAPPPAGWSFTDASA